MRASASSRFNLETSASRSVTGRRLPSIAPSLPWRALYTQFPKVFSDIERRVAASGIVNA